MPIQNTFFSLVIILTVGGTLLGQDNFNPSGEIAPSFDPLDGNSPNQIAPANHYQPELAPAQTQDLAPSFDLQNNLANPSGTSINPQINLIQPPNAQSNGQAVIPADSMQPFSSGQMYSAVDFMFLERSGPSPQGIVFDGGGESFNASSIKYSEAFSPAATIGIGDQFGNALEFNYLTAREHGFNGTQNGTGVTPVFFGGIPAVPAASYTINAVTQMDNYELIGWGRYSDRLRLGFGLRIVDMSEQFDITETNAPTTTGFFSITDNELYGAEIAAQYLILANSYARVYVQGRFGPYYNRVKVNATALNFNIAPDSDEFAVIGDLRLVGDFPITQCLSFRAGYQATFFSRIAQGIDQNDNLTLANAANPGQIDFSSPSYRGGFFGFVVAY